MLAHMLIIHTLAGGKKFIGPGLAIDTNRFFVICTNVLGGCYGSTGPSSFMSPRPGESSKETNNIDATERQRYATRFPILTIFDMIRAQFRLLDSLGIQSIHASIGASMGGMQSLAAGVLFTDRVKRIVTISSCARSHPYSIALRHCQRQVLMTDPNWNKGEYYGKIPPHVGMKLAREIATITYRSGPEWEQRFGRKRAEPESPPALCPDFLIETYLDHQSEKFCLNYDANSLLYISKAMDMFDLSADSLSALEQTSLQTKDRIVTVDDQDELTAGLSLIKSIPTLILGVQSDILFPCWQQKEIADCLRKAGNPWVHFYELDAMYGHDTFLIDLNAVGPAIKGHLEH
ncbi:Serine O-succinyltransferase [Entomophthora muscae]|uniref:Serine O-succinyltransferase n=1 Tax=Entomophthora muscae TaxID=34485 RepID=A0ACC2S710_9FUNG|nr:Serine O-succinyltransferase [Entomophthora muscae]